MRTKPRILTFAVLMALALAIVPGITLADDDTSTTGSTNLTAHAASDHTADDAINWAKSQVGHSVGVNDGSGYYQCVEFIQAYYQYLGVSPVNGNGCDYASNALPAGWTRTAGGTPQKGDILVYGAYGSQTYGHVAIYESDNSLYDQDGSVWGATVKHESQNYRTYTWAYWGCIHPNFSTDTTGPSYSEYQVGEIGSEHFTAMAKVTDPGGVRNVRYAVWTEENGQDDLVWYDADYNGNNGNYWKWIPYSDHKNEKGKYIVHMYAYDNAGNLTTAGISYRFDVGDPVVENFHAWELKDNQFTVSANITSPNGIGSVRYAVWTEHNGQDDLVWKDAMFETTGKFYYVYVPFSEHSNERGNYIIHLYAYDTGGKLTNPGIGYIASDAVPSVDVAEGAYTIRSKLDTSKGFDVWGNSSENQANVVLHQWNGGDNQKYSLKAAGDGSYYIVASHSNKAVEVYGAYGDSGASISQFTQNQTDAQRWYFVENDNGTYTIRNKATGHVMDADRLQTADGTIIQQYPYNGGDNQKFYLVPTDASKWSVSLPSATRSYTGKAWEPVPTVTAGGVPMVKGRDYTVSYKNNVNAGTATMTVAGTGGFTGSKSVQFTITSASQGSGGRANSPGAATSTTSQSMHRLYNPNSGEHFYTSDDAERDNLAGLGWSSEGDGWTAPASSGTPVYRMYNPNAGEHHYTPDVAERDMLVSAGWNDEGIGWYSDDNKTVPLYRDYNPNAFANNHNYTVDRTEHEHLVSLGWRDEGIAWYGL